MVAKLAVLTSCFFPNRRPIAMFERSARRYCIGINTYGDGRGPQAWRDWTDMKVVQMIPVLEDLKQHGYTHVLYHDGRDAFFVESLGSWKLILDGRPALVTGQWECFPLHHFYKNYDRSNKYCFTCPGGYIGEISWWLQTHREMLKRKYWDRPGGGDEATLWQYGWDEHWFRPAIDTKCELFQVMGCSDDIEVVGGEVHNKVTDSYPIILHFSGSAPNAVSGSFDTMIPWWNKIHPDMPITKEECSL